MSATQIQQSIASHRTIPPGVSLVPPQPRPPPNPRATVINNAAGGVTGEFQLHDSLRINTIAGSIDITVILRQAAPSSPHTIPELKLSSSTGNITVHTLLAPGSRHSPYSLSQIPDRQYIIAIESRSGNITATLPHARKTSVHTVSGNISASLHPIGPASTPSTIDIRNASGSTQIALYPHLKDPATPLRVISGDFHGTTGSLNIVYPLTWEGDVESKMSKGMVKHQWPGLRVVREGPRFTAKKGRGVSRFAELNIHGKGMQVNLMGMNLPLPWLGPDSRRESWGVDATRPPSYVGPPPTYEECVGTSDAAAAAAAPPEELRLDELDGMLRERNAVVE